MKHLNVLIATAALGSLTSVAAAHASIDLDTTTVLVTKDERAEGRACELKGLIMHTKGNVHGNHPGHRLTLELRKQAGTYYECPATVTMNVENRAEVMKLYELVKQARKVVCQTSSVISGSHLNVTCDGSFEIRD